MPEAVPVEFAQFVAAERRAGALPPPPEGLAAGQVVKPVFVESGRATELVRAAARHGAGLFHPTTHAEMIWVDGSSELAVGLADLSVKITDGLILLSIPVRCDQARGVVEVAFAVGSARQPAGLFASTYRRPNGPVEVVDAWGEALVAFGWQCLLGLVTGVAGAIGKDERGNLLVPVDLAASDRGLQVLPMARHRFTGSSGLTNVAPGAGGKPTPTKPTVPTVPTVPAEPTKARAKKVAAKAPVAKKAARKRGPA